MDVKDNKSQKRKGILKELANVIRNILVRVPLLGWLLGTSIAVIIERLAGKWVAINLGLPKIPVLFGFVVMLKKPFLIPSAFLYVLLIYILPIVLIARFCTGITNRIAEKLIKFPIFISTLIHIGLIFLTLYIWSGVNDYRLITLKLILVAVMVTLSLNIINGYMGEFSCSHPGFMALGAYASSVCTIILFVENNFFNIPPLLPEFLAPLVFPIALIVGGIVAMIGALLVAIPSFRTRGDYLAIISLAFTFIIISLIQNLEIVGGPRGLGGQPNVVSLPMVFICAVICIWTINNFVRSTLGKALNAVRDNEMAANAMTVNTRRTKITAFLFAAFWAGVAGGIFAHIIRYVNPGTFGIQKLAEVLSMVYFGGLNSVYGSIVGAVGISLLSEALRPLEIFKWIIIPLMLILVMIFRPTGLISFKDLDVKKLLRPKNKIIVKTKTGKGV